MVAITSITGQQGWAFVPDPLPPLIQIDATLGRQAEAAAMALGMLSGFGAFVPDAESLVQNPFQLLNQSFVRREALASSRIEGTRAEFDQLVLFEADPDRTDPDIQEVRNYIRALETGWNRPSDRPISTSFIMELHQQLMTGVRGQTKQPGGLRPIPVLIGGPADDILGARFVPPPPGEVRRLLDDLTTYIATPGDLPALIRLALVHYQFEAIHPFLDGNGRLGRLLLPLLLKSWGVLDRPLLYLSAYFEQHRDQYIDLLFAVSQRGAWNEWIGFMLTAVETQARDAVRRGHALLQLRERYRSEYRTVRRGNVLPVLDSLFARPTITISAAARSAGVSFSTASAIINLLVEDGILMEQPSKGRSRVFLAPSILSAIVGGESASGDR